MRIAVDVMGGDHAPAAILEGALAALPSLDPTDELVLVGDEQAIRAGMAEHGVRDERVTVVASSDDIGMDEPPVEAVRSKPNSSIVLMSKLANSRTSNPVDVIISAGNTGACVCAAQMFLRRLPGAHRPGISVIMPTFGGPVVLCDVGANPDPKPHHLCQYGLMGEVFAREMLGVKNPRVALMNIGSEEAKGTDIIKRTRDLLKATPGLNYVGYIEGRAIFEHEADVVATDGFVGNAMIKLSEGLATGLFRTITREIMAAAPDMAGQFGAVVKEIYKKHDYHEQGGAPLLGINGTCIICHGSSDGRAITNAVRKSRTMVNNELNRAIVARLAQVEDMGGQARSLHSDGGAA